MKLQRIKILNFRNIEKRTFDFKDLNVIVGPNASGKSSILEAIYFISSMESVRASFDKELIKIPEKLARIEAVIAKDGDELKVEMVIQSLEEESRKSSRKVKINGTTKSLNRYIGTLISVIFTPMDLEMLIQGPAIRRRYLDRVLSQISFEYRHANSSYKKIIRSRNRILEKIFKEGKGREELNLWDELLEKESRTIHKFRKLFIKSIEEKLDLYWKQLNPADGNLRIRYKSSEVSAEKLSDYREKEILSRSTLIGPGKDDFRLELNGLDLEIYGSRGQQRTGILTLKLAEIDFLEAETGFRPILILDDIFSELDEPHRLKVFEITGRQQTFIATTDPIPDKFVPGSDLIKL